MKAIISPTITTITRPTTISLSITNLMATRLLPGIPDIVGMKGVMVLVI
jgi:hypothetical protein